MYSTNPVLVSASVLSADFLHLAEDLEKVGQSGVDMLHLDVMDGHFVPNLSFGAPLIKAIAKVSPVPMGAHFMVENPMDYLELCKDCGIRTMTIHAEVVPHLNRALSQIREAGMLAGVALNPATPPEVLEYVKEQVDFVLPMTVNPGFSGQSFIKAVLPKIARLREMLGERVRIGVDGGVSPKTAPACLEHGADVLIAATAIFGQTDYTKAIKELRGQN
ncbi:MAG: ribulose-phosphate 3-epimerase [bacterium]|nr:ribulose-phosphate 3-epimerase [bacterium]